MHNSPILSGKFYLMDLLIMKCCNCKYLSLDNELSPAFYHGNQFENIVYCEKILLVHFPQFLNHKLIKREANSLRKY